MQAYRFLESWNFSALDDPAKLERLRFIICDIVLASDQDEVQFMLGLIEKWKQAGKLSAESVGKALLDEAQLVLRWTRLAFLPAAEQQEMISTSILSALQSRVDVAVRISAALLFVNDDIFDSARRQMFLAAIQQNKEQLDGVTIAGLVLDYDRSVEKPGGRGKIDRITFLQKYQPYSRLDGFYRLLARQILQLYDMLRFMPVQGSVAARNKVPVASDMLTPLANELEVFEEAGGLSPVTALYPTGLTSEAVVAQTKITPTATALAEVTPVPAVPLPPPAGLGPVSAKESQEVEKFFQTISPSTYSGNKISDLRDSKQQEDPVKAMLRVLSNKKQIEVQAYLRYFALSGELPDLMLNPEIMKIFKPYLERKLGQAAALAYTSKPKRPTYVKLFLQWVFEVELGMTTEDAKPRIKPITDILAVDDPEFFTGL